MSILRRDFGDLLAFRNAIDRILGEGLAGLNEVVGHAFPVDMYETADAVVIKATLPGVQADDVQISILGDTLTIKGEVWEDEELEEEAYICKESRYGSFSRTVSLPIEVNADASEAKLKDGVLTLTLPKVEGKKAKSISVSP
ncbi:MAG: Hsp20/alpha crystallin family protein, partial [Anaerolineae bacterium]|nr:Hsp20/alpha crystallin family protein [Anaerolineae bacterium]